MPGPKNRSNGKPSDNEHPFLTPKGYRLMHDRKRVADSVPVEFPKFDAPIAAGTPVPIGTPIVDGVPIFPDSYPAEPFSTEPEYFYEAPLQNILPSKQFPDPKVLSDVPMTRYFDSKLVSNPQRGQLKAIGKLLIQVSDSPLAEPATGSAWIAGPSLIITSAHNLYEFSTGTWSKAIEFHPGYDYYARKEMPTCRVTSCCIPRGYMENPATNHDIAACFVDRNIGDIVGAEIPMRPVKENAFFDKTPVTIVGYPAGSGFDFGKQMWQSKGEYLFGRSNGPGDDYAPVLATDFGSGASGCPWLVEDKKNKKLVAVGVTSAHAKLRYRQGEPNLMSLISPYFGARLFDSLSHDHVFHEFAPVSPQSSSRDKG